MRTSLILTNFGAETTRERVVWDLAIRPTVALMAKPEYCTKNKWEHFANFRMLANNLAAF